MAGIQACPVEGCQVRAVIRTSLWVKFLHCHTRDTVVILEEGNRSHPCCLCYYMFVLWTALNVRHPKTTMCVKGGERKCCWMVTEES